MEYVPVVTVMVRGLSDGEAGVEFAKRLSEFLEDVLGFDEESYSVELKSAYYDPDLVEPEQTVVRPADELPKGAEITE